MTKGLPQPQQVFGHPSERYGVILFISQPCADDEAEDADEQGDCERRRDIDFAGLVITQSECRVQLPHGSLVRLELALRITLTGIFSEPRKPGCDGDHSRMLFLDSLNCTQRRAKIVTALTVAVIFSARFIATAAL